ncbi:translocation/assembly module TamB domain-containing protein [Jannaschia sp. LMIT008]|uniref:translocation/assembly module TamB domain-containing protein n=1 Tax=Jannaschia maritima TaxID=3032585 RepID=UPI002810ACCD|nr:translocation/assembly module TamB domain-containing protein [Jannaschia sp. LMIT008]
MRGPVAFATAALLAVPVWAQDDRDPGFLAGLIEEQLNSPGLNVQIDGFDGALSSTASVEELRIADDEGTWLVMQDVVLDWNRSALLRGRLEVEELSAQTIRLERLPLPAEGVEPPAAAATGFSLPELPVSIDVEALRAERIELGQTVLGQEVALSLAASARLADGSGAATIEAQRLDGVGTFSIAASYDAETQALAIDLDVREAEGGIAATLLNLPGAPAIELTVAGEGPLDAFAADIALASDGVPRLDGRVALNGTDEGRRFDVDLGGDVTALFAPRYQSFFGDDVRLVANGLQGNDGRIVLDDLDLTTRALVLRGEVRLGPDGWPELLDVTGRLASANGSPVLLPLEARTELASADFALTYDPAASDNWLLSLEAAGLDTDQVNLARATLTADGVIARDGGTVQAATAVIRGALEGLSFADQRTAGAVGDRVDLSADVDWRQGGPVTLSGLTVAGAGYGLDGDVVVDVTAETGLPIELDLSASAERLAQFAALAGLDLSGAAQAQVNGTYDPIGATFDLELSAATDDLGLGIAQVDPLLAGRTTVAGNARRTTEGSFLDGFRIENEQMRAAADVAIFGEDAVREDGRTGQAVIQARIFDGTLIDPRLDGEIALDADVAQDSAGVWAGDVALTAPEGVAVTAQGTLTGDAPDVTFDATVPRIAAFVPDIPGGARLSGRAFQRDGVWNVATDVAGPWDLTARIEGPVTGDAPRIAFAAELPDLSAPVPATADIAALQGGVRLDGTLSQADGVWSVDTVMATETGIVAQTEGVVLGAPLDLAVAADVPALEGFADALRDIPPLTGAANLTGRVTQPDDAIVVDLSLRTASGITAAVDGPVTGSTPRVAIDAQVPEVRDFIRIYVPALESIEALQGPAILEAVVERTDGAWTADASVDGPAGLTARARGDLTGDDALDLALAVTVADLAAFADLAPGVEGLNGALSIDGRLENTEAGFALVADARGPQAVRARVDARLYGVLTADFALIAPDVSAFVPAVRGGLDVTGTARLPDTGPEVILSGTAPFGVTLDRAVARLPESGPVIQATGTLADPSQFTPQLQGAIDFDVAAEQVDGAWRVEADASGAQGLRVTVQGIATGEDADLTVSIDAADVSPFAPGLSGPLDADGRLFWNDGGYAFDVDASGPLGATLSAEGQLTGRAPEATFDLSVPNIAPLVPDLNGPLRARGTARQQGEVWAVDVALDGPGGTTARVAGTAGASMDLTIDGQAPLGLANAFIAPQRITGTARFDLALRGAPALENLSGTVATTGAALSLPTLRNGLMGIDATVNLSGSRAQVTLSAGVETGGRLSVTGPIGLTAPFDANLAVQFDVTATDPNLYTADLQGNLSVAGPLTGGARIAGTILIDGAEISVPSSGLTGVGDLPPVTHVNTPRPVRRTLALANLDQRPEGGGAAGGGGGGPGYGLDIRITAPNRIFVRGRGLDAELGGDIVVRGTTNAPVVSGGFELARGRLDILQQRFALDEGSITFQGDLVPFIRLVAITQTDALTASIIVEGPATEPEVRFESSPDVPQEEILAQIFFGRDLSELSPLQAIQLANSVAVLAGRGSGGLLERLRGSAGLDDLDVTTDADGNTAVRAGKYISDNVYTDVQVNQQGEAAISLNIDVTPNLTVRGATGADGEASVGLFFERDY